MTIPPTSTRRPSAPRSDDEAAQRTAASGRSLCAPRRFTGRPARSCAPSRPPPRPTVTGCCCSSWPAPARSSGAGRGSWPTARFTRRTSGQCDRRHLKGAQGHELGARARTALPHRLRLGDRSGSTAGSRPARESSTASATSASASARPRRANSATRGGWSRRCSTPASTTSGCWWWRASSRSRSGRCSARATRSASRCVAHGTGSPIGGLTKKRPDARQAPPHHANRPHHRR